MSTLSWPQTWRATAIILLLAGPAHGAEIWAITDAQHPIAGHPDRLISLDAAQQLERDLSADLPDDSQQAAALVQKRLNAGGAGLQKQLTAAYQGVVDAWSLGITKVPAVVVDRRYVVYGESDLGTAVARIEQFRKEQP
ncbi:TIGR03757 family integrating conjugative element protein [Pseudomonas aeruginosa]|uniref:TIGR03757 family integrating conjugative element protein n=1 Tax=Pseudomonas aeruginosa TaxID=287 RepID=UPI000F7F6C59|nr:TIGR03757 family integrating conjugative element protein [Pseudomonas aeruginosa]RTB44142.1 TIGR03757 family integrating conjugative element protein [Pseudomonas aeruginosa]